MPAQAVALPRFEALVSDRASKVATKRMSPSSPFDPAAGEPMVRQQIVIYLSKYVRDTLPI
eukprot:2543945-Pyramimonas_sp.AAC.1